MTAKSKSSLIRWTKQLESMRTLSLRQPWAWLVVNGYKDIRGSPPSPRRPGRIRPSVYAKAATLRVGGSDVGGRRSAMRRPLSRHQLDLNLPTERASSSIESSEGDRSVLWIEQSMNRGPGRPHFCGQSAFAQLFFLHQVMHFQGHCALERRSLNLFHHSLFSEEIPETAAAMPVSRLN